MAEAAILQHAPSRPNPLQSHYHGRLTFECVTSIWEGSQHNAHTCHVPCSMYQSNRVTPAPSVCPASVARRRIGRWAVRIHFIPASQSGGRQLTAGRTLASSDRMEEEPGAGCAHRPKGRCRLLALDLSYSSLRRRTRTSGRFIYQVPITLS
jgi:hypothetical protein